METPITQDNAVNNKPPHRSSTIGKIADALAKAQATIEGASKDGTNPHLNRKYASLTAVWDACRDSLTKNGLSVVQASRISNVVCIETILMHTSGEWISSQLQMTPVKNDPQGIGSCLTYARRYSLAAMVGVCPEDDDGISASTPSNRSSAPAARPAPRDTRPAAPATGKQDRPDPQGDPAKLDPINAACLPIDGMMKDHGISEAFIIDLMCESYKIADKPLSIADLGLKILNTINTKTGTTLLLKRWNDRDAAKYPSGK